MTARNLLEQLLRSSPGHGVPRDDLSKYATGAGAASPEMAAEIYLASVAVVDDRTTMERAYLKRWRRR